MGIHTGRPTRSDEGYVGIDVHRAARICAAGHGGQVLVSHATRALLEPDVELRDLGEHRLKDLPEPEWLFQLLDEDLASQFPPLRTLNNTNLPAEATSLIGRRRDLEELSGLIRQPNVRLVTLTGPGGIGKTRLALRLAAELVEEFKNGVFQVPLAPLRDPAFVLATIAQTLGAKECGGEELADSLRRHLEGKSVLVVLDNFEHLIPAAPIVSQLLGLAPGLKVIATSRGPLHLAAEHEYPLASLAEEDAIALFDERARAVRPSFRVDVERALVVALCRRLEGLPLGIELAAARVKVLSTQELLERLEPSFALLTSRTRDAPSRHQTLRAVIDWSYQLLDEREQRAFTGLSIFAGGFDLRAAEAVCGSSLDDVESLLDKSLIRRDPAASIEVRFSMLEMMRGYALDRLGASGAALRGRHARYFTDLALVHEEGRGRGTPPAVAQVKDGAWLDWLVRERQNLTSALSWFIDQEDAGSAVQLFLSIWRQWVHRGPLAEGRGLAEKIRSLREVAFAPDFAWFLWVAAQFPLWLGDYKGAQALAELSTELLRASGDKSRLANALETLGYVVGAQNDYKRAAILDEESLEIARELNDPRRMSGAINGLGILAFRQRDFGRMLELAEEEVALQRALDEIDPTDFSASLHNRAEARRHQGSLGPAARDYVDALTEIVHNLGDRTLAAECIDGLADVALMLNDHAAATQLWAFSQRVFAENGDDPWDPEGTVEGVESARQILGQQTFDTLWQAGETLRLEEAVVMATAVAAKADGAELTHH
ncbi:MAG: AAA family ATPase [Chloroflexota bacterium]|nr:AAA family ATPase [Chloroflexota bacterium]